MNRALILGVVAFLAIIGIALMASDNSTAQAGHGCCGCHGGCHGCHGCYGGGGHGCHGYSSCCGCNGGGHYEEAAPAGGGEEAPAPAAARSYQRKPFGFRQVSFRR